MNAGQMKFDSFIGGNIYCMQKQGDQTDRSWILATKLANIEMNIPTVIVKTNYLAVSQALFLRGILFLGLAASTALISKVVTG